MKETDLKERFIARDLSWLDFNERVMDEAVDAHNPLLERLRFLAIFTNNLDEFYMVRIAGLKRLIDSGHNQPDKFGYFPQDLMNEINEKTDRLMDKFYSIYDDKIKKELSKNNIALKTFDELNPEQKKLVNRVANTNLFPIITPMAIDQGHPFPILPSRTLGFAVNLLKDDKSFFALIPIPKNVPRLLKLPSEKDEFNFILVDEIIRAHLGDFFRGYKILSSSLFRLIRDSEVNIDEESSDLMKSVESEVKKRRKAKVVYLEMEKSSSQELADLLCQLIGYPKVGLRLINSQLDLSFLFELAALAVIPKLNYRSFVPKKIEYENIFDKIKEDDQLVVLPYQPFQSTVDLFQSAAKDPDVLAIKITLYRTNEDSQIIQALKEAAKNKKQVTAVVELKARFDEEKNIDWAKELEDAGCHVIYGMPGMKIHSKMALIVRREDGRIRRYVHLSTGNYNEKTARVYTDINYFTANDDFAKDVSEMFNVVTGYSLPLRWKRIISSPHDLRNYFFELIDREIECQKKYKNGFIFAKFNSLEDPQIIEKLYAASKAGVKIQLIVRGICCLIPGVAGLSENIEVHSIVGRFLEHMRIYMFNNNGSYQTYLASADWMTRNLDRRIELLFEVQKDDLKEQIKFLLEIGWQDNVKAYVLSSDGRYTKYRNTEKPLNSQDYLIDYYSK